MKNSTKLMLVLVTWRSIGAQSVAPGGVISGKVVNDAGASLPSASVNYRKQTEYIRDRGGHLVVSEGGFGKIINTVADGTFTLSGLPPGRYIICAYGSQPNQVSGCDWDGGTEIRLAANQIIRNVTRTIHEAAILTFRVADAGGKIALPDSKGNVARAQRFFLGVSGASGRFYRADLQSSTPNQKVFSVAIAKQRTVRLFIDSDLSVQHSSGMAIETKRPSGMTFSPGSSDQLTVDLIVP